MTLLLYQEPEPVDVAFDKPEQYLQKLLRTFSMTSASVSRKD